jgi:hypothetical protein
MDMRAVFDAPGFDAELAEFLESQAIRAAAVEQRITRLRAPNRLDQINNIFPVESVLENVFIAPVIGILLEKTVGDRSIFLNAPDLMREFALAHLGQTWRLDVPHFQKSPASRFTPSVSTQASPLPENGSGGEQIDGDKSIVPTTGPEHDPEKNLP